MRRPLLALSLLLACSGPAPAPTKQAKPSPPPELPPPLATPPTPTPPPPELPPITPAMLELPWLDVQSDGCTADIAIPPISLADPFTALVVVASAQDEPPTTVPLDCTAPIVAELPRELLAVELPGKTTFQPPRLDVRLEPPAVACGQTLAVAACLRDRAGRLHPGNYSGQSAEARTVSLSHGTWSSEPRFWTPSGPVAETRDLARGWQLVGAEPITGTRVRVGVRAVRRAAGPIVVVTLTSGEQLQLFHAREVWNFARATWVRAADLVAGDRLIGLDAPVEVREVERQRADRWDIDISDVDAPDTYFLGSVLVRDGRPTKGEPVPLRPEELPAHRDDVDILPAPRSYDCQLDTRTEIRRWPDGAAAIALLSAPHPGPPGARVPLACDPKLEFARIPKSLWDAWRADPRTAERLLAVNTESDGHGCMTGVAVTACAAAPDGALTPLLPSARWGLSGPVCFAAGTPIDTLAGPIAIENLPPAAALHSFDVATGEPRVAHVQRRVSRGVRPVLKVTLANGDELRLTAEHPLWLPRAAEFRPAGDLRPGDHLLARDGELQITKITPDGDTEVYELSVDAPDTYFAAGVLAHNY